MIGELLRILSPEYEIYEEEEVLCLKILTRGALFINGVAFEEFGI